MPVVRPRSPLPWIDMAGAVGDARGSSANALDGEFIGDYNWIVATNTFSVAGYNDHRDAAAGELQQAVCPFAARDEIRRSDCDPFPGR